MVKVAALRITTSGKKVRVACGKFSDSFLPSVWAQATLNSVHQPLLLNPDETVKSKQIFLYRGLGFRISPRDTVRDLNKAILKSQLPPELPVQPRPPNPSFGYIQERSQQPNPASAPVGFNPASKPILTEDTMVNMILSMAQQKSLSTEGDAVLLVKKAKGHILEVAKRCVSRNILKTKISRYIPQHVKIAVAVRDHGRCTYRDMWGNRCPAEVDLQFDHRFWPFSLGGTQETWNLTLKCGEHNREESDNINVTKALQEAIGVYLRW